MNTLNADTGSLLSAFLDSRRILTYQRVVMTNFDLCELDYEIVAQAMQAGM